MRASRSLWRGLGIPLRSGLTAAIIIASGALAANGDNAGATTIAPTAITATASTDNSGLGGAVPNVLVAAGGSFNLTVTLSPPGSAFNNDTTLNLTPDTGQGGTFTPGSVVMPGGTNSATFAIAYSAFANGVQVNVGVAKTNGKLSNVTSGATAPFDVLKVLSKFTATDPRLATGLGVGNADCTQATTESECGTLILSHGIASGSGALSLGACSSSLGCTNGSQVVQFVADLGSTYTSTDPALLIIRCSKQQCPGKGINTYTVKLSFQSSGPLDLVSAPCLSKGVALDASNNTFCTDYVQSHRDNAGDALLYVLFTHDMRGST
jgi:hypothetical protein